MTTQKTRETEREEERKRRHRKRNREKERQGEKETRQRKEEREGMIPLNPQKLKIFATSAEPMVDGRGYCLNSSTNWVASGSLSKGSSISDEFTFATGFEIEMLVDEFANL